MKSLLVAAAALVLSASIAIAAAIPQSRPFADGALRSIACSVGTNGHKHPSKAACIAGCRNNNRGPGCERWCERNCD